VVDECAIEVFAPGIPDQAACSVVAARVFAGSVGGAQSGASINANESI
jgi:hypothetical protein